MPERQAANLTSGGVLARNAVINLAGQMLPILVAVIAVPLLIQDMGTERFGVLALAWIVTTYFGLFDFGLGRATTKFVAEYQERGEFDDIPELVWSSLVFHVGLGVLGGCVFAALTPLLTNRVLSVPAELLGETTTSFYLLAASVPLVVATAALRGVLEALQRFDMVNAIKIPASVLNYFGPLPVLLFVDSLTAVVAVLVLSRGIVLVAHYFLCLRAMPALRSGFRFSMARMKPLIGFGGWLTVNGFVYPSMVAFDRFMIGAFVSLSSVALYVTPYEVVTKLTVFSAGLLSVLFPAFSALALDRGHELRRLYGRAIRLLLALVAPVIGLLLALAYELMSFWVAPEFAQDSAPIAKWLAAGVLFSILSHAPLTIIQGIGRADVTAKLQVVQLPIYALLVWYMVTSMGAVGVAIAWTLRSALDAMLLLVVADRLLPEAIATSPSKTSLLYKGVPLALFLVVLLGLGSLPVGSVKMGASLITVLAFGGWEWFYFLEAADRKALVSGVAPFLRRRK